MYLFFVNNVMDFSLFFENYLASKYNIRREKRPSRWREQYDNVPEEESVAIVFENGAKALLNIGMEFANYDFSKPPTQKVLTIVRWDAAPFSEIMDKGLGVEEQYKGKGFASRVMNIMLGISKREGIDVIGIWSPTKDSQKVMDNYVKKGILIPEEYSKAELDDYYTRFRINWSKAHERIE